jgi:hypothetical protein
MRSSHCPNSDGFLMEQRHYPQSAKWGIWRGRNAMIELWPWRGKTLGGRPHGRRFAPGSISIGDEIQARPALLEPCAPLPSSRNDR